MYVLANIFEYKKVSTKQKSSEYQAAKSKNVKVITHKIISPRNMTPAISRQQQQQQNH
jgi:hypothetical protein